MASMTDSCAAIQAICVLRVDFLTWIGSSPSHMTGISCIAKDWKRLCCLDDSAVSRSDSRRNDRTWDRNKHETTHLSRVEPIPDERVWPAVNTCREKAKAPTSHGMRVDKLSRVEMVENML